MKTSKMQSTQRWILAWKWKTFARPKKQNDAAKTLKKNELHALRDIAAAAPAAATAAAAAAAPAAGPACY